MNAQTAAATAVATAELSAAAAIVPAETAYLLTYNMIKQNQGALSFPLIALSFTAITAGLAAYVRTQAAAAGSSTDITALFKHATEACQRSFAAAVRRAQSGAQ
jgi:hypothetical protein